MEASNRNKRRHLLGVVCATGVIGTVLAPAQSLAGGTLTPSTSNLVYGNVPVGSSSPMSVTLTNASSSNTVGDDFISGANPSEFATDSACDGETVGPGDPCTIQVTFEPTSAGMKAAVLNIPNDGANPDLTVNLSGTGVTSSLTLSPAAFDFGSLAPGMLSAAQTFTATSDGTGTVTVSQINITGANSDQFQRTGGTCPMPPVSLNPTASCTVAIAFAPTSSGSKTASLAFTSSAADSPDTATLTGTSPAAMSPPPPTLPATKKKCKKGRKLKKGKCVKKKRKKKRK